MADNERSKLFQFAMDRAREDVTELKEPEEDIMPVFLWTGPHGTGLMPLLGMRDGAAKDRIAGAMMAAIVVSQAAEAAMITTSWMVKMNQHPDEHGAPTVWDGVMPSQHPDRVECITVLHADQRSCSMGEAELTRYPHRPPDLGEWNVWSDEGMKMGGRFGEAMGHGLQMVQESPPAMVEIIENAWLDGQEQDLMQRFLKVWSGMTGNELGFLRTVPMPGSGVAGTMTARQVSDEWNIPLRTIYEVCKSGFLPARRVKGRWLIQEADAVEYALGYRLREREMNGGER
jgi:hypothetical protein